MKGHQVFHTHAATTQTQTMGLLEIQAAEHPFTLTETCTCMLLTLKEGNGL